MLQKSRYSYPLIAIILLLAAVGCKKSNLTQYTQPDMVYFYRYVFSTTQDSITYSFAIKPDNLLYDTVKIPVRIHGLAKNADRKINLRAVADSTNATSVTEYEILPAIVHAGRYNDSIPILIKRSASLKTKERRLLLEIVPSDDFLPGIPNTKAVFNNAIQTSGGSTRFLVKMNDFLTKPSNWDSFLVFYFGDYSAVKYKFIIEVTGRTEFPAGPPPALPFGIFEVYRQFLAEALLNYEQLHGPLLDENGNRISF